MFMTLKPGWCTYIIGATDAEGRVIRGPVVGSVYDYSVTSSGAPNQALQFLREVKFAVGTWGGGKQVWVLLSGQHYEVHYSVPHTGDLFELRPIENVTWSQGLIVVAPD